MGTRQWVRASGYETVGKSQWVRASGYEPVGTRVGTSRWVRDGGYETVGKSRWVRDSEYEPVFVRASLGTRQWVSGYKTVGTSQWAALPSVPRWSRSLTALSSLFHNLLFPRSMGGGGDTRIQLNTKSAVCCLSRHLILLHLFLK